MIGKVGYNNSDWKNQLTAPMSKSGKNLIKKIKIIVYCELELSVGVAAVGGLIFKLAGF